MEGFENAIPVVEEPQVILPTAEETIEAEKDSINLSNIHGLSNEEFKDVNKIKDMTVDEFVKLVKSNKLISEDDAHQLIESFKKISSKKNADEESTDSDQRKKKYREQHKDIDVKLPNEKNKTLKEIGDKDNSIER